MTVRIVCLLGLNGKLKTEESQINSYHNHDSSIAKDELAFPKKLIVLVQWQQCRLPQQATSKIFCSMCNAIHLLVNRFLSALDKSITGKLIR